MKKVLLFSMLIAGLMLHNACSASLNLMKGGVIKGSKVDDIDVMASGIYYFSGFSEETQIQDQAAVRPEVPDEIESEVVYSENYVEPDHFYDPESFRYPSGNVTSGKIAVYILIRSIPLW